METEEKNDSYREYPICRTCLNVIRTRSYRLQENSGCGEGLKIAHVLRYIVPELYLGLSNSPQICGNCRESLRVAYTFRKLCLETETMIGNYLKNVRCTAQVIDLGAVINYLSNKKVQQNAEKIISEWEDDSCDDPPAGEPLSNKKIQMNEVDNFQNAVKFLSQKSAPAQPHQVQYIEPDEKSFSKTEEVSTESEKSDIDTKKLLKSKKKILSEHFKTTDLLNYDCKSGFYFNSKGKRYVLKGEKAVRVNDSQTNKQTGQPTSNKESTTEKILAAKTDPKPPAIRAQTSLLKNLKQADKICESSQTTSKPELDTNKQLPKLQQMLTVCEETGLLKNGKGEYFNLDGTPMDKEQVKAEKDKAKIRGESLFTISNICTVTDDEFEDSPKSPETHQSDDDDDDEDKIPVNLIAKDDSEKAQKIIRAFCNDSIDSAPRLQTTRVKQFVGSISVKKTSDLINQTTKTVADISVLPKLLQKPLNKTYERSFFNASCLDKTTATPPSQCLPEENVVLNPYVKFPVTDSSVADVQPAGAGKNQKTNILNFLLHKSLGLPETPAARPKFQVKTTPPARKEIRYKPKNILDYLTNKDLCKVSANPTPNYSIESSVKIKQEPSDFDFDNATNMDSEDTLSAPDTEEIDSWESIINSLDDSCNNYVDVPEFVKINNVTMVDLEALRAEGNISREPEPNTGNNNKNLLDDHSNGKLNGTEETVKPITVENNKELWDILPERFPYNGKMLVKCGDYYKFEDDPVPTTKQTAKRRRFKLVPFNDTAVSNLDLTGPKYTQTQEAVTAEMELPNRETCVLFTNYTLNGFYINDHDYLVSPYVRNKMIVHEGNNIFCRCFICGFKHWMRDHVKHMLSHSPKCPVCSLNLGTPYMLNLHMKIHAIPCNLCSEVVPYSNIFGHKQMHEMEDDIAEKNYDDDRDEEYNSADDEEKRVDAETGRTAKSCFVPACTNTSRNSAKIFIFVPRKGYREWFKAIGRLNVPYKQNTIWCCEDHFDMDQDCENWQQFKLMKVKLRFKKGRVPHKYIYTECPYPKKYSQLDKESKIIREKNMKRLIGKKPSGEFKRTVAEPELSDVESHKDEAIHTEDEGIAKRRRSSRRKKDEDYKPSESDTSVSPNLKLEPDESTDTAKSISRRSLRARRNKLNEAEKDTHKKMETTDGSDTSILAEESSEKKTEVHVMTDADVSLEKGTEDDKNIEKRSDDNKDSKNDGDKDEGRKRVTRGKKRGRSEVECLTEEQLTKSRVLRTRAKKPNEDNKNESPR